MTPRFEAITPGERMRFVGGTEDFDIYVNVSDLPGDGSVVIYLCSGHSTFDWGSYPLDTKTGQIGGTGSFDENDAASDEFRSTVVKKKKDVEHYIRLFVPWVME